MTTIRKFLDLSTGYLTQETRDKLDAGYAPVPIYPHPEGYGWFLWAPDGEYLGELEDCPTDLLAVFVYAAARGCDYVLIDRDGPQDCEGLTWHGDSDDIDPHDEERHQTFREGRSG